MNVLTDFNQIVKELSEKLNSLQSPIRILDSINWPANIRQEFLKQEGKVLPEINKDTYLSKNLGYDPQQLQHDFFTLETEISKKLGQLNPAGALLIKMCREFRIVLRMIEARGTPAFHALSTELYGGAHDVFHPGEPSLAELGIMLEKVLEGMRHDFLPQDEKNLTAEEAVVILADKLNTSMKGIPVKVVISDGIVSDAAAGSDTIKINKDAMFSMRELEILEVHEGWIHLGTTFNGLSQPYLKALAKGTPSATVTQEGLAVLTEIITLHSTPERLSKLVSRIRAATMATDGADFVEIYRYFTDKGIPAPDAFTITSRAFRGSVPTGLPFTKDISYIKGFVLVYNLIRVAIQLGRIDRLPILMCGKINLDDFKSYTELLDNGTIMAPSFIPPHFSDFRGLAAWLSFGKFIGNLSFEKLEQDYAHLF
ncbi:flavohemoglobin expression-modulating QEGLA motif protein [Gynuella sunshinyii]|uniref:Flavohemoglobin expression-modulating QEGLA motif protein n=1 Tax=Gynuella sunshinyii YC6258 TaxID=1445510 RepID=A0A0C5VMT0_9GAMM|nr:flavohemoglobin expression-modulating QEGLA motif protein [Gynuella sunshinyii]AJQ94643.1 hypothetical protein YC6258_02606 [Gynuella sunshinyii YC6258]